MKINVEKVEDVSSDLGLCGLKFSFSLESDDSTESLSTNAGGGSAIKLMADYCHFYFPMDIDIPHADLCAFAALKIISPYIGSHFEILSGVSAEMAVCIRKAYPNIKDVKVNDSLGFVKPKGSNAAVSFSGGVDSIAAACIVGPEPTLVMAARTYHPKIGEFESWNNPRAQVKTLQYMPHFYKKVLVYTDFNYLSTNGKFCIYPDSYAFCIPAILLSQYLGIDTIITGDILGAFTGNETTYSENLSSSSASFFKSVGITLDYPCNGMSEILTTKIAKDYGLLGISSACEFGDFKKPCMKCVKCFRKSIYSWALFGTKLSSQQLEYFNNSPAIDKFANGRARSNYYFMPSFKYCFNCIGDDFSEYPNLAIIRERALSFNAPYYWVDRRVASAYKDRSYIVSEAADRAKKYAADMQEWDLNGFKMLNWKENFPKS